MFSGKLVLTLIRKLTRVLESFVSYVHHYVVSDITNFAMFAVVIIGAVLFAFQQFAGINAIFYFSSAVFKSAGLNSEIGASVAVGVVNLIGTHQPLFPLLYSFFKYNDIWLYSSILP